MLHKSPWVFKFHENLQMKNIHSPTSLEIYGLSKYTRSESINLERLKSVHMMRFKINPLIFMQLLFGSFHLKPIKFT